MRISTSDQTAAVSALSSKAAERRRKLTAFIRQEAEAQGFDLCRVTLPTAIPEAPAKLSAFLEAGRHGTMEWMEETKERRADPRVLWSEVRSIVLFGLNYGPEEDRGSCSRSGTRPPSPSMHATAIITMSSRAG